MTHAEFSLLIFCDQLQMADIAAWWEPLRAAALAPHAEAPPLPPGVDRGFVDRFARAVEVVRLALHVYRPHELALSFNGGKDCTAVLHLVRYVLHADGHDTAATGGEGLLQTPLRVVFFAPPRDGANKGDGARFPEEEAFMAETAARYSFVLREEPGGARTGLAALVEAGVRAIFMGTRASDPHGAGLDAFTPTSLSWPPAVRVCPVLGWEYADVWTFLRGAGLPACPLYARGFTSLGSAAVSRPNPALALAPTAGGDSSSSVGSSAGSGDASGTGTPTHRPAWELDDGSLERSARADATAAHHPPAAGTPPAVPLDVKSKGALVPRM